MGIFDDLKNKVLSMSEETVRQVDWDEVARKKAEQDDAAYEEEVSYEEPTPEPVVPEPAFEKEKMKLSDLNFFGKKEKQPKAEKPAKPPKEPKAPKPPKPAKQPKQKVAPEPVVGEESPEVEKEDKKSHILGWFKKSGNTETDDDSTAAEDARNSQAVQDILEFLQIKASHEIPPHILLVEDLEDIGEFDLQMPKGYDMGQVRTFVEQTKDTVKHLQGIIEERNDDIAKLATAVDRLQVDLHNSKFETEVASGVNILPTEESEFIASENLQLKVQIRELQQQLQDQNYDSSSDAYDLTEEDQQRVESLQDQLSIAQRHYEDALDENKDLRARLAYLEEELDDPQRIANRDPADDPVYVDINDIQYEDTFGEGLEDHSALPSLDGSDDYDTSQDDVDQALPSFDFDEIDDADTGDFYQTDSAHELPYPSNSNFTYVDEPLDTVIESGPWNETDDDEDLPSLEPETPEEANIAALLEDDDEDDILDKLIRERQGGN